MDSPSSKRIAAVRHARKGTRLMAERLNERVASLNVANESLQFDIRTTSAGGYAVSSRRGLFSFCRCISAIFSRECISSVLEDILQSNTDAFCHKTGGGGMSNAPVSARDAYQAFACRVWIQGRGVNAGQRTKDASKNALKWIGERCTERVVITLKWVSKDFARTQ